MSKPNNYESVAKAFIKIRGQGIDGIGTSAVRMWAQRLPRASAVLDLGCGTGIPITKVLIDEGLTVYGIEASPTLVRTFHKNFPDVPIACEYAEDSPFFHRNFDAIIAWGLIFLLSADNQTTLLRKMAKALRIGGKLLFTAPSEIVKWEDILTGQQSRSLGAEKYKEILLDSGLSLIGKFEDEGQNHYYNAVKL